MPRTVRLAFLSLALFLILFPLGIVRPGWPPTLKADEPAYFAMAQSLAYDLDIRCELQDVRRLVNSYPFLPINNLILMSDDGWETVYYGKPYVFSLLAAPAVRLFGEHGMIAVNMLLLVAMIWMGATYLSRFNSWSIALLFSVGFFVLSAAFVYVFWLQPEILNMFSIAACLFLAFHRPEARPRAAGGRWELLRILGSGAVLALAVYNKPVFAAMGLPALWLIYRRRGLKSAGAWIAAAALSLGLLAGLGYALSGHPTAYLGAARGGVRLTDPQDPEDYLERLRAVAEVREDENFNAWSWIFHVPKIEPESYLENVGYFLWGRHTGLLLYTPLAALAFLLFLLHTPRSSERWVVVGSAAIVALFFLSFIQFNWHGGGGFVGNRYFINVYPAFLFLATRLRPNWTLPAGFAVGAIFLGPLVFTPFGAPVPNPTLQAHTRNFPFRELPLELSIKRNVPGYDGTNLYGLRMLGRVDQVRTSDAKPGRIWIQGGAPAEIHLLSTRQLGSLLFEVQTLAAVNDVRMRLGADEKIVTFGAGPWERKTKTVVELEPGGYDRISHNGGERVYVYLLDVETSTGTFPRTRQGGLVSPLFYSGVAVDYLGRREQLDDEQHYRVSWLSVEPPERVAAGSTVTVRASLRNDGETPWVSRGPVAVNLGYHWLDADGGSLFFEGKRTAFREEVAPADTVEVEIAVQAPDRPGRYVLELDLVRERISWFSNRGAETYRLAVDVEAPAEAVDSR